MHRPSIPRRAFLHYCGIGAAAFGLSPRFLSAAEPNDTYPKLDLHVHLSREITLPKLKELSERTGCKFGIVEHPGPRYSRMTDDPSLNSYLDRLGEFGLFKGVQPVEP